LAGLGYYGALRHLPGKVVLPVSHLYLVFGPLLIALLERRALNWQQFAALCLAMTGLFFFVLVSPEQAPKPALEPARPGAVGVRASRDGLLLPQCSRDRLFQLGRTRVNPRLEPLQDVPVATHEEFGEIPFDVARKG
jgi:hypothetical protein